VRAVSGPQPREDLAGLTPYRSSDIRAGKILLHANENPYPPPPAVVDEIVERLRAADLNRYPPPEASELRAELASYAGVDPEWIWVGDGSNEVLLQACLAYGGPGRSALVFEPSYRMHYRQATVAGTRLETSWRGEGFAIDTSDPRVRDANVVFLCTPNNPTGTVTSHADVTRVATDASGLVVVDEAYHEFCGLTFVDDLAAHPNVLVVRTLSKAFRLAGVRLGYAIGHPDLFDAFRRVRMPYSLSTFTQIAALTVLRHRDEMLSVVAELVKERERIAASLSEGAEVFASGANFILFRHPEAKRLFAGLLEAGIVLRDFTELAGTENCLRLTVGRREENDAFLEAVSSILG
jgi:histidinol-phosphate aminotransferase